MAIVYLCFHFVVCFPPSLYCLLFQAETHEDGDRKRYFADDDKHSLSDLVRGDVTIMSSFHHPCLFSYCSPVCIVMDSMEQTSILTAYVGWCHLCWQKCSKTTQFFLGGRRGWGGGGGGWGVGGFLRGFCESHFSSFLCLIFRLLARKLLPNLYTLERCT